MRTASGTRGVRQRRAQEVPFPRFRWADLDGDSPQSRVSAVISRLGEGGRGAGEVTENLRHLRAIVCVESSSELPAAILGLFPRNHEDVEPLVRQVRAAIAQEEKAPARAKFESLFG